MNETTINPNSFVDRIRLIVGDFMKDEPYLPDSVYVWLYEKHKADEVDAAIEALESIINNIALSPSRWTIGEASEWNSNMPALQRRLDELKLKRKTTRVPVIIRSDRKAWDDFNNLFGGGC